MDQPGVTSPERSHNHVVFEATMAETRATLREWNERPARVISEWMALSLGIALTILSGILLVSTIATPDGTVGLPNIFADPQTADVLRVFIRNMLVLALHAFVCIAGFMAMRALPAQANLRSGFDRWIHHHAGRFTMVFVTAATLFSITTQIYILGHMVADLSYVLGLAQWELLLTTLPHALIELTAVFLPLAAFLLASRRKLWHQLLAATAITVAIATPMIIVAAFLEAYLWPPLLRSAIF